MNKVVKRWKESNMTYRLLALAFSIVLFLNANNNSLQGIFYTQSETYNESVSNVPVNLIYDSDEYYVHGYQSTVNVNLSSINRVQLDSEVNEDTRSFQVVADLSALDIGTHEVTLRTENLSSAVNATIATNTITVTIEKRVTQEFDVTPVLSDSALASGYAVDLATASPASVEITTGEETLEQIDRVVAVVSPTSSASADFSQEVSVSALDSTGQSLSMMANPTTVNVSVTVVAPEKEVSLTVDQEGNVPASVTSYRISLSTDSVTISGEQSAIDLVESIAIPVNISGVTTETVRSITVPTANYISDPAQVRVTIVPVFSSNNSSSTTPSSNSSNNNNNNNNSQPSSSSPESSESSDSPDSSEEPSESSEPETPTDSSE